jgi:hypothetical protein
MSKAKNNAEVGATKPKGGKHGVPLSRKAGMAQAVDAIGNKTRSRYKGSSKHNHYEGCSGYGENENVHGYGT